MRIQGVRRNEVASAGLEFQHTGDLGSLITSAFSVSDNGNQVFRVPLWDVAAQRSATGGYPWYIEGHSSTLVYIKNATDQPRQFRMYVMFDSDTYLYPLATVPPSQTTTIDIRSLRDNQVPDMQGNTIPLTATHGQIQWSMIGGEDKVLIGRSEQVDPAKGISSNYACINCCGNSFYDAWLTPNQGDTFEDDATQFQAMQQDANCYGYPFAAHPVGASFSGNPSICNPNSSGLATGVSPGQSGIFGQWGADEWISWGNDQCQYSPVDVFRDSVCNVLTSPDHLLVVSDITTPWCTNYDPPSMRRTITYQVVDRFNNPVTIPLSLAERFLVLNDHTCGAGAPFPSGCAVKFNGLFTDTLQSGCSPTGGSCGYDVINQLEYCRTLAVPKPLGLLNEQVHFNQITVNGNSTSLEGTYIYP